MLTIGSTAITSPGSRRKSPFAAQLLADEVRHLGIFVHLAADAVADKVLDDREPVRRDVRLHLAGHFAPAAFFLPISSIARSSTPW